MPEVSKKDFLLHCARHRWLMLSEWTSCRWWSTAPAIPLNSPAPEALTTELATLCSKLSSPSRQQPPNAVVIDITQLGICDGEGANFLVYLEHAVREAGAEHVAWPDERAGTRLAVAIVGPADEVAGGTPQRMVDLPSM